MSGHSCDVKFSYFVHFFVALITLTVFSRRNKENGGFNKIWDILTFAVFGRRLGLALKCESDANKCESENGGQMQKANRAEFPKRQMGSSFKCGTKG